jgi:flagellar basal-body rod protein FlgB
MRPEKLAGFFLRSAVKPLILLAFLRLASSLLIGLRIIAMIEALFNQPNYLSAKKMLDAIALRQEAIANNLNNLETPGYQRMDLAPQFERELQRAAAGGDPTQIESLAPSLVKDAGSPVGKDGNTVHLESELMQLNQNSMAHALETQLLSGALAKMRLAITGRG